MPRTVVYSFKLSPLGVISGDESFFCFLRLFLFQIAWLSFQCRKRDAVPRVPGGGGRSLEELPDQSSSEQQSGSPCGPGRCAGAPCPNGNKWSSSLASSCFAPSIIGFMGSCKFISDVILESAMTIDSWLLSFWTLILALLDQFEKLQLKLMGYGQYVALFHMWCNMDWVIAMTLVSALEILNFLDIVVERHFLVSWVLSRSSHNEPELICFTCGRLGLWNCILLEWTANQLKS